MLSHSLSFWFSALIPNELDLRWKVRCRRAVGPQWRRGWSSPHAGAGVFNVVVHLQIFWESTELRSVSITVCLSVQCQGSQAGTLSHLVTKANCSHTTSYQLQVKLGMGTTWPWAGCARGVGAGPWGWQSGQGGLDGCLGCLAQPSTPLEYHTPASP